MIELAHTRPFARGGNRLCFVHPDDPAICIKVPRPDVDLAAKRARKGLKGRLKPARAFDDNASEAAVLRDLHARIGTPLAAHVPRFLGWVESDLGRGVMVDLVRGDDAKIALPLKQWIWENGLSDELRAALDAFSRFWIEHRVPSRDLLLHNVVVAGRRGARRLVVIDGLGNADLLPFSRWFEALARQKARRKIGNLNARIETLLQTRARGGDPGQHGFLDPAVR